MECERLGPAVEGPLDVNVLPVALAYLISAGCGVLVGFWTASITYLDCPGPLCIAFLAPRFAMWQCALLGLAATLALFATALRLRSDVRRVNARLIRWLFEDLNRLRLPEVDR